MARNVERCTSCAPGGLCRRHQACLDHRDAWLAAELGCAWATRVWHGLDVRRPWPLFEGRCAETATRLVAWLTKDVALARRRELAELCSWRAGIRWEALQSGSRDRPYRASSTQGLEYGVRGHEHVVIRFRASARAEGRAASQLHADAVQAELGAWAEQCGDCNPTMMCSRHAECDQRWDARLAADVGIGWACYVWTASACRAPWPAFADRCAATALHLVSWLANHCDDQRRHELAAICCWRARIRWDGLRASNPRPSPPRASAAHAEHHLAGGPARIRFRASEERGRVVPLASEAIAHAHPRAARYREAQGLRATRRSATSR